ncbi:hypothetical protein Q5P01_002151 [Channa striata]|uniref:Uncharacterized protein n=1 Tax=Channa striata TaxID=64152 RepID=A0AA88NSR0_CHASR|nr:hypothetical protein Q5P01_002151 [Channa striata]
MWWETGEEEREREKWRRRWDLWHRQTAQRGEIHKHEVREYRSGGRRGRKERESKKDKYTVSERLSLIDKLSLCSGNPPHTHTPARYFVGCASGLCGAAECEFEMQSTSGVLGSSFCSKASLKRHLP